jgi:hypothetical protein
MLNFYLQFVKILVIATTFLASGRGTVRPVVINFAFLAFENEAGEEFRHFV